jgi:dTDP-4-dehydrorhamnose reductase
VFWGGVTTIVLADAIQAALTQGITGLYHLTNNERISKFELLKLFNELRNEPVDITPSGIVREDKSIVCTRKDFEFRVPSYAEMVHGMGRWIKMHKKLYPQYGMKG